MAGTAEKISIANIITNGFGLLGRHALVFFGFSLLFFGLPQFGALTLFGLGDIITNQANPLFFAVPLIAFGLFMGALYAFLQSLFMLVAVHDLSRQPATLGYCISQAFRKMPGVIGLGIVMFAAFMLIMLGVLLPIIGFSFNTSLQELDSTPGLVGTTIGLMLIAVIAFITLTLIWMVAIPAKVMEPIGVLAALGRSRRLTAGSRLRLLLLGIIFFFFNIAISLPLGLIAQFGPVVEMIATVLSSAINIAFASAMVASAYIELRAVKEGASTDELADVFA